MLTSYKKHSLVYKAMEVANIKSIIIANNQRGGKLPTLLFFYQRGGLVVTLQDVALGGPGSNPESFYSGLMRGWTNHFTFIANKSTWWPDG